MTTTLIRGELLSESLEVDPATFERYCRVQHEDLIAMVDAGLLEPRGDAPAAWRFSGVDLQRARTVQRLVQDLGVNLEGAALILDLLAERAELRGRMRALQALLHDRT